MTVSGALLAALSPVMALVAVAIRLETPGPVIYRQTRVGRGGQPFTMLKFRSMQAGADQRLHEEFVKGLFAEGATAGDRGPRSDGTPTYKLSDDPRVTRVGAAIRRLSVDELPQLVNVIRGDMSLVGPRPDVPYAVEEYDRWHWRRFEVLPGLTGLWQVSGRGVLSPTDMLELDVEYVDRWSLLLDIHLLVRTIPVLLRKLGSA